MDIEVYESILNSMKDYNSKLEQNYGNTIVSYPPANPTYPLTIFEEIRNVPIRGYNTCRDRLASLGYRLDIYAKTKGNINKQVIARHIAKQIDNFLTNYVGLTQISWNVSELENDASIYHIIITYTAYLHENRKKLY